MATNASGEFEEALKRLEEIVQKLEKENVALDESVALFKEGKGLAVKCERLLKDAQTSIEAAARGDAAEVAPAQTPVTTTTSLFGNGGVDDADPDL